MRSCISLLAALFVLAAVLLGGLWLYHKVSGDSGHVLTASPSATSLTLENQTHSVLTVTLTGPAVVRFQIAPGHSQKEGLKPGTYAVEGSLSDPNTDPFRGEWTFELGRDYQGGFTTGGTGGQTALLLLGAPSSTGGAPPNPGKRKPGRP